MRNRTSLALIELVLMFFVFALASAWCLRGFVWADQQLEQQVKKEKALLQVQNMAEILQSVKGNLPQEEWIQGYDLDWNPTEENPVYILEVKREESQVPLLGCAKIIVRENKQILMEMAVAWQEVERDE